MAGRIAISVRDELHEAEIQSVHGTLHWAVAGRCLVLIMDVRLPGRGRGGEGGGALEGVATLTLGAVELAELDRVLGAARTRKAGR